MEFYIPSIKDIKQLSKALEKNRKPSCEMSPANTVLWARRYNTEIAFCEEEVIFRSQMADGTYSYSCNLLDAKEPKRLFDRIVELSQEEKKPLRMHCIMEEEFEIHAVDSQGKYSIIPKATKKITSRILPTGDVLEALYVIRYKKKYMIIIIGIALIIAAISYVVLPVLNAKKQYIEMLAGYDGENMKTRIKVFEEGIEHICIQGNDRVEVTFDKIQKVIESRNLFILLLKGNVAIVAEKSKFEKGNPYGFANFIRYKITNTEEK